MPGCRKHVAFLLCTALISGRLAAQEESAPSYQDLLDESVVALQEGRYEEGIAGYLRLLERWPEDSTVAYDIACGHSLLGDIETAFEWLERSGEWGGLNFILMRTDSDLDALRADPRFEELVIASFQQTVGSLGEEAREARRARADAGEHSRPRIAWQDGHSTIAKGVVFAPNGHELISWADGGRALRWDVETGELIGMLGVHGSPTAQTLVEADSIYSSVRIEYGPDSSRVVIHDTETLKAELWDPVQEERITTLGAADAFVTDVDFAPDGTAVVTADLEGRLAFFEPRSGALQETTWNSTGPIWRVEFDASGKRLVSNGEDGVARVWDVASGAVLARLGTPLGPVFARLTDDRRRLVVFELEWGADRISHSLQGRDIQWQGAGGTVRVFELGDGPELLIERPTLLYPYRDTREGTCTDRSGTRLLTLATTDDGARLELWDVDTGERLASSDVQPGFLGHALDGKGERVVHTTSAGMLHLWGPGMPAGGIEQPEVDHTRRLRFAPGSAGELFWVGDIIGTTAFELDPSGDRALQYLGWGYTILSDAHSGDGQHLALVGYPDTVALLETREGGAVRFLTSHASQATDAVALSVPTLGSDRPVVLSTADKLLLRLEPGGEPLAGQARLWDAITGEDLGALPGYQLGAAGVTASADGERIAVFGSLSSGIVSIHGTSDLRLIGAWDPLMHYPMIGAAFGTDGERLLITDTKGSAILWNVEEGSPDFAQRVATIPSAIWVEGNLYSPQGVMSPDGALLAVSSPDPVNSVDVRYAWDGLPVARLEVHPNMVRHLAFSPDVRWLLSCSTDAVVVETSTWEPVATQQFGDWVLCGAWSPDSRRYLVGCDDGSARLCRIGGDAPAVVLSGHGRTVRFAAFDGAGERAITCSDDGTARLWDAHTGELLLVLRGHAMGVKSALFVPGTERLVTVGLDATHRVWDLSDGRLLQTRVTYESGEWLTFSPDDHYDGTQRAADWARISVQGRTYPLSSYAEVLHSPERVAAAMRGDELGPGPRLDEAPDLLITGPEPGVLSERTFELEVHVFDRYGIAEVRVLQDGTELAQDTVEAGLQRVRGDRSAKLSLTLSFPPDASKTEIRVRAENQRDVLSRPQTVSVSYEPPKEGGDLYVVALAVQDFEDDGLDLRYPIKDADDVIERFGREQGDLYREVHVKRLVDGEVTRGALSRLKDEFLWGASADDTVLVFVAGHGVRTRSGDYYFLTPEATPKNPYDGIPRKDLYELVEWKGLEARRRLLLIDTCQAGEEYEGSRGVGIGDAFRQDEVDQARGSGLYIVAASTELGVAREERGNGLFTRALLDGLAGNADRDGDGWIDIGELLGYTREAVLELSDKAQRPTMPRVEGGDPFHLARSRQGR